MLSASLLEKTVGMASPQCRCRTSSELPRLTRFCPSCTTRLPRIRLRRLSLRHRSLCLPMVRGVVGVARQYPRRVTPLLIHLLCTYRPPPPSKGGGGVDIVNFHVSTLSPSLGDSKLPPFKYQVGPWEKSPTMYQWTNRPSSRGDGRSLVDPPTRILLLHRPPPPLPSKYRS